MFRLLRIQYPDGNATIYLMRRLRSDTLKAAGEVVGINKNSTVSNIIDRAKYETTRDKGIRLCVENTNQKPEQRSSVDLTPFLFSYYKKRRR